MHLFIYVGIAGPRGRPGKSGKDGLPGIPGINAWKVQLLNGSFSNDLLIPPSIAGKYFHIILIILLLLQFEISPCFYVLHTLRTIHYIPNLLISILLVDFMLFIYDSIKFDVHVKYTLISSVIWYSKWIKSFSPRISIILICVQAFKLT